MNLLITNLWIRIQINFFHFFLTYFVHWCNLNQIISQNEPNNLYLLKIIISDSKRKIRTRTYTSNWSGIAQLVVWQARGLEVRASNFSLGMWYWGNWCGSCTHLYNKTLICVNDFFVEFSNFIPWYSYAVYLRWCCFAHTVNLIIMFFTFMEKS